MDQRTRNNGRNPQNHRKTHTESNRRQLNKKRGERARLKKVHTKLGIAFGAFIVLFMFLLYRIGMINFKDGDRYSKEVLSHQTYSTHTIAYERGQIQDRNGTILAYSEKAYNIVLDPLVLNSESKYKTATLNALQKCFGIDINDTVAKLAQNPESRYLVLLKMKTMDEVKPLQDMITNADDNKEYENIRGIWLEDTYIRKYPFNTLACNVIGFANSQNGGELGLESYYDDELTGVNGVTYGYVGENLEVSETTKDAVDGNTLVTTLDYGVQSIIEKKIQEYNAQKPSQTTAVLVMDPNDGAILGMASTPVYNLNDPRDYNHQYIMENVPDAEKSELLSRMWSNYCISNTYEPGSTFKPFTVAAGLEEGVTHDGEVLYCNGYEEIGGYTIKCHVYHTLGKHGDITLEQALMQSCNPAMMQIAARLGGVKFAQYQALFGFGSKTGIDLPAEEAGITKPSTMSETDVATNSFGQNINVNMVQMAAAFSSLINGGNYYRPHVVKRIEKKSGEVVQTFDGSLVKQTVTPSTSQLLKKYLKSTVDTGLAVKAGVTGYSIGGKTGTAQKGKRDDLKWIISFIGFAPVDDPKFVIYVIIDEPDGTTGTSGSSGDVLTLTHDILEQLLPYMNVYKDAEDTPVDTSDAPSESTVDGIPLNNN